MVYVDTITNMQYPIAPVYVNDAGQQWNTAVPGVCHTADTFDKLTLGAR